MLLALALVASLGVTSAFAAVTYTNAESAAHYQDRINYFNTFIDDANYKIDSLNEIQDLWQHYLVQKSWILNTAPDQTEATLSADMKALLMDLDIQMGIDLADLKAKYAGIQYTEDNAEAIAGLYVFDNYKDAESADDVFAVAEAEQEALAGIIAEVKALNEEEDNVFWLAYFTKLAEKDAEKAAAAEAAAAVAKKIADATKGIDTTTPAGQLLYDGTVAKLFAQESLDAAKKAADTAKKAIATAQKGAFTEAQAAVLDAQAYAYQNLATGINTAVADYVASVYTAIDEFYIELYK